ncbi:prepilin-type N-terminal cleavage/methylation domain-containing protein [Alteromonas gracilis]|uniref:prepilin-type N-terminal cleavage/methylation domain-containing protein n=1 Tax=Alteromonas gracilis TaxID=1479524 RepID=UPI00321B3CD8
MVLMKSRKNLNTTGKKTRNCERHNSGYTLLELMIVVALICTVSALSIPSFYHWKQETEFKYVLRAITDIAHRARVSSITLNKPIHLKIGLEDTRCIAISENDSCDCTTKEKCSVNGKVWAFDFVDTKSNVSISTNSTKKLKAHSITFNSQGTLHFANNSTLYVQSLPLKAKVTISVLGRIKTCTSEPMTGFSKC